MNHGPARAATWRRGTRCLRLTLAAAGPFFTTCFLFKGELTMFTSEPMTTLHLSSGKKQKDKKKKDKKPKVTGDASALVARIQAAAANVTAARMQAIGTTAATL
jgi:hypothetical protein